jgi:D-alanine-D-alanine ligase-like ATP-grasp enzyme
MKKGKIYQIFGFDILIDEKLKAWLLEVNDYPSMNIYSCKESMGCAHKNCPVS